MRRELAMLLAGAAVLVGCGSNTEVKVPTPTPTPVSVSLTPSSSTVEAGQTVTFTVTVTNSQNQNVTWQVNGKTGGDSNIGTVSGGTYTAPSAISAAMQVTITAISIADTSKSASVTINVTPEIKLTIEPAVTRMPAGAKQTFSARLSNGATATVTWQATIGSITADGEFTAPNGPTTAIIQAQTSGSPTRSASVTIDVVHSNAVVKGKYIFAFDGTNAGAHVAMAGSFVADGNGTLSEGILDSVSATAVERDVPFTGTYAVNEDGRGTMTLSLPGGVQRVWQLAVFAQGPTIYVPDTVSSMLLAEFSGGWTGSGTIEPQTNGSAIAGDGIYLLSSSAAPRGPAMAGYIDVDSTPNAGEYDLRAAQQPDVHQTFTAHYSFDHPGRVLLTLTDTLGTHDYRAYVTGAAFYAVSLDTRMDTVLRGIHQATGTLSTGTYLVTAVGDTAAGGTALAGGDLVLGNNEITSGTLDTNVAGSVTEAAAVTGTYTPGPGRAELHLTISTGSKNFIAYTGGTSAALLSTDSGTQMTGWLELQPIGFLAPPSDLPCYEAAVFQAFSTGADPSLIVGRLSTGDAAPNTSILDVFQSGTALPGVPVSVAAEPAASGARVVLRITGPVTRTYAAYGCRAVSIDGRWAETGILLGRDAWPAWWWPGIPFMGPI